MYGDLTKTQSEEEDEVKCNVAQKSNDSVILERKKDDLTKALLCRILGLPTLNSLLQYVNWLVWEVCSIN